jgi:DNA-directed RNA polymerase specialized sigma24 family protein
MTDDGSLTHYALELHAPDPAVRQEAARQLWLRFAGRLRGVVRRRLDPRILRQAGGESDLLQSVFAGFFAAPPGPGGPPRSRDDLWRLLVHFTLCKVANTAHHHRAARRDVRRVQPLGDFDGAEAGVLGPEAEAVAREEFDRLLALLPEDLQRILALRLEGYTVAEIAARLGRVERTVELKLRAIRGLLAPHLRLGPEDR